MGSTSIDWDTVQVVKDPKKKQVEVGFVKQGRGATVGSSDPCVRILAPNDYFPYKDNSGHYYIAYLYDPAPVDITGTVTHTTGGICEANSILVPQEMAATSTFTIPRGATEVRVDLQLGTVLVDVTQTPDYKAAYTATLTSVTNGQACGEPQCIKFNAGTSVIPPDPDPGPEPEPETEVPPDDDQLPECDPQDCSAYLDPVNGIGGRLGGQYPISVIEADLTADPSFQVEDALGGLSNLCTIAVGTSIPAASSGQSFVGLRTITDDSGVFCGGSFKLARPYFLSNPNDVRFSLRRTKDECTFVPAIAPTNGILSTNLSTQPYQLAGLARFISTTGSTVEHGYGTAVRRNPSDGGLLDILTYNTFGGSDYVSVPMPAKVNGVLKFTFRIEHYFSTVLPEVVGLDGFPGDVGKWECVGYVYCNDQLIYGGFRAGYKSGYLPDELGYYFYLSNQFWDGFDLASPEDQRSYFWTSTIEDVVLYLDIDYNGGTATSRQWNSFIRSTGGYTPPDYCSRIP